MEIKVSKNNWEILGSGYLVLAERDEIDFSIDGLNFKLTFKTDTSAGPRVGRRYDKKGDFMAIICENFDKSNFRTISQPIVLAKKDGRDIALEISVMSTAKEQKEHSDDSTESKVVFYCWCISKETSERQKG